MRRILILFCFLPFNLSVIREYTTLPALLDRNIPFASNEPDGRGDEYRSWLKSQGVPCGYCGRLLPDVNEAAGFDKSPQALLREEVQVAVEGING